MEKNPKTKTVVIDYVVYEDLHRIGDETFSDSIARMQRFYKKLPDIKKIVNDLFAQLLRDCHGNTEKTELIERQRSEALKLFEG